MSQGSSVEEVLEERPDLADALAAVYEVDRQRDHWKFEDVPVESGPFGELVSRGLLLRKGEGFTVANPDAVAAAVGDGSVDGGSIGGRSVGGGLVGGRSIGGGLLGGDLFDGLSVPSRAELLRAFSAVDRTTAVLVGLAIALVGAVRAHPYSAIYRDGDIVLSGNDPYYYRYWAEQAVQSGPSIADFGALAGLPGGVERGEPLLIATLWWFSALFGDGARAVGHVLAWYPVVTAMLTAGLVYLLAVRLTSDRRVGLASVLALAVVPGHAMRTSLGFADHHAFDYPWLAATALLLVVLAEVERPDLEDRRTWAVSGLLGVVLAGQILAWDGAPLLFVPVGLVVVAGSLAAVRDDRDPWVVAAPVVAGVGTSALLSGLAHLSLDWQSPEVALSPAVLLAGILAVVAVAEAVSRSTGDVRHLLWVNLAGLFGGLVAVRVLTPGLWAALQSGMDRLFVDEAIAEALGLFDPTTMGFLLLLGFSLVFALPVMAWSSWRAWHRSADRRWIVPAVYAWFFLVLSGIQVRFVGELAPFLAVYAGAGIVWTAAWIDAIPMGEWGDGVLEPLRVPDRGTLATLSILFLLFASLGLVQVPVKTSQVTIPEDSYATASFIADRSAELGQEYPENYVLTRWGRNRMYNYFVSGESWRYEYALNNYESFLASTNPDGWYDKFDERVGYVVTRPDASTVNGQELPEDTAQIRLQEAWGSRNGNVSGVGHYQALFQTESASRKVFAVVPGAVVEGTAQPNATVSVSTSVSVPTAEFTYERVTTSGADGTFQVRVANPGEYAVTSANASATVDVSESLVRDGGSVSVAL